jgi:transcription termination factor Rho
MASEDLSKAHIAEIHERAAAAGIPGYRRLRREELIERLGGGKGDGADQDESGEKSRATRGRRGGRSRQSGRGGEQATRERERPARNRARADRDSEHEDGEEASGEPVSGVLDVVGAGHGFLRLKGLEPDPDDIYISASQIRRCELRAGDQVEGPARPARRGERHPALVRVEKVNGAEPGGERSAGFDQLTPVLPHRRLPLTPKADDVLLRAVDLLAPLAFGQRVLVVAGPRSGRTTFLREIVKAIDSGADGPSVIVLLVDERPEEVTAWKRLVGDDAEIAAAPADLEASDQVRHAELAMARAKRRAESGEDVVVIVDSLTRLGVSYRDPIAVKPIFGAGRELEEEGSGSLTLIATVLRGTEDGEGALEAVETTENATVVLDPELAGTGVVPAIDATRTRESGEEELRDSAEIEAVRRLREELGDADSRTAAEQLGERIRSSASNAELLSSL